MYFSSALQKRTTDMFYSSVPIHQIPIHILIRQFLFTKFLFIFLCLQTMIEISNVIYDPKLGEIVNAKLSMRCLHINLHENLAPTSLNIYMIIRKGNSNQQRILLFQIQKEAELLVQYLLCRNLMYPILSF